MLTCKRLHSAQCFPCVLYNQQASLRSWNEVIARTAIQTTTIMRSEALGIRDHLDRHHDSKFGFVVYRCVYGDDHKWASFMERLTAYTNTGFRENEDGEMIKPYFAWDPRSSCSSSRTRSEGERTLTIWELSRNSDFGAQNFRRVGRVGRRQKDRDKMHKLHLRG